MMLKISPKKEKMLRKNMGLCKNKFQKKYSRRKTLPEKTLSMQGNLDK